MTNSKEWTDQGRTSVDIPSEVPEDLRGLGFTWEKIGRIFRTIMRRVRLFDLGHLSLFSTMTDEEIHMQYYSRLHLSTTWVNRRRKLSTGALTSNGLHCTKEAYQRQPEPVG